jgi:hypothetical protein
LYENQNTQGIWREIDIEMGPISTRILFANRVRPRVRFRSPGGGPVVEFVLSPSCGRSHGSWAPEGKLRQLVEQDSKPNLHLAKPIFIFIGPVVDVEGADGVRPGQAGVVVRQAEQRLAVIIITMSITIMMLFIMMIIIHSNL